MHRTVHGEMDVQVHAFLNWSYLDMSSQLRTTDRFRPDKITPSTLPPWTRHPVWAPLRRLRVSSLLVCYAMLNDKYLSMFCRPLSSGSSSPRWIFLHFLNCLTVDIKALRLFRNVCNCLQTNRSERPTRLASSRMQLSDYQVLQTSFHCSERNHISWSPSC